MVPVAAAILRMRWLSVSATYTFPAESSASAVGRSSIAAFAGPPSPKNPAAPVPATVAITPVAAVTTRTRWLWLSAIYRLRRIHREPHRRVEFGSGGRAIVARESLHSVACYRGHHPGGREFENNLVSRICNEEVALRVEGNRRRKHQRQRCAWVWARTGIVRLSAAQIAAQI